MQKKNYPLNQVKNISNLRQLIDFRAEESGKKPAFIYWNKGREEKIQVTYEELKAQIEQLETYLLSKNFSKQKIAILGENSYEWILSFFAVANSGNIAVPMDKELSVEAIAELMKNCGCSILIFSDTYRDVANALLEKTELTLICMKEFPGYLKQGEVAIHKGDLQYQRRSIEEDAVTAIFYTSGTSGKSKGVMLSQKNLAVDTRSACRNFKIEGDTVLLLPLHHTFGLVTSVFATMLYGHSIFINSSLRYLLEDISLVKPYVLFLVPLFVENIYKNIRRIADSMPKEKMAETPVSNLKMIVSGGALLNPTYIKGFASFGITLINGYGITECAPVVSVNRNEYNKEGSVGLILDECQVKIHQPDKNGEGEICVKGANVMLGYYRMEEETAEVLRDGWFHTGDIGHVDEDQFLYITGRKKNLIILENGENVAPEELENELQNISLVKEAVVYEKDRLITAEIFMDEEEKNVLGVSEAEETLRENIRELNHRLPAFKRIMDVKIRETEFVKTTTKKIIRHLL